MDSKSMAQEAKGHPCIYAYEYVGVPSHEGCIKIGYTVRDAETRIKEQNLQGRVRYRTLGEWDAVREDGTPFRDADVHRALEDMGRLRFRSDGGERSEWFRCTLRDIEIALFAVRTGRTPAEINGRTKTFAMRPEQEEAVAMTASYFRRMERKALDGRPERMLWNAKMRFGKTFAAYQLAKRMGMKRVLILTFKPAVQNSWRNDLLEHADFDGWQFIVRDPSGAGPDVNEQYGRADKDRPIVCFGSFQDFLGADAGGGMKPHHEWLRDELWDMAVFDEYHFGAWRGNAKRLFEDCDEAFDEEFSSVPEEDASIGEDWLPIRAKRFLYLSGTPFRALQTGEFMEDQIYGWTYSDEQRCKAEWPKLSLFPSFKPANPGDNPYAALPRMNMHVYRMPDDVRKLAAQGEFDEFDLSAFFAAEGAGEAARFVHEAGVRAWLSLVVGSSLAANASGIAFGRESAAMPLADRSLMDALRHVVWFLPDVASCHAMANLLAGHAAYAEWKVNVCAGAQAGIGAAALKPVLESMGPDPLKTKTITLTCGKLLTGVTVPPWTGIFMLRNLSSPEAYFQAAFRVQSAWERTDARGRRENLKPECWVFDFSLDRALRQIFDYSSQLKSATEFDAESQIREFTGFLPVLACEGGTMRRISASEIIDVVLAGTSAPMLARRWESAQLVNVDNSTLERLLANADAMDAVMRIEGFRSLNAGDVEAIVARSKEIRKMKSREDLPSQEKRRLASEEKDVKSKRRLVREKLLKFLGRLPLFMYLTDEREACLRDVIMDVEPALFRKVTGLTVKDFELLVKLNVFNGPAINGAIWQFRTFESASLNYTGVVKAKEAVQTLFPQER